MYIALAVVLYLGLALLVGRFCSLNSRWETAIGEMMEADALRARAAAKEEALAFGHVDLPAATLAGPPQSEPPAVRPAMERAEDPIRTPEDARPVEVG